MQNNVNLKGKLLALPFYLKNNFEMQLIFKKQAVLNRWNNQKRLVNHY